MNTSGRKSVRFFQVDAFTDKAFTGNPAAVCLLEEELEESTMKKIAAEINLSETAFVIPTKRREADKQAGKEDALFYSETDFSLRWFTPKVEVNLCGHATLATAAVIFALDDEQGLDLDHRHHQDDNEKRNSKKIRKDKRQMLTFQTLSGQLESKRNEDYVTLFMPTFESVPFNIQEQMPEYEKLIKTVIGDTKVEAIRYVESRKRMLVHIDDKAGRSLIESFNPNFAQMTSVHNGSLVVSVTLTTKGSGEYDFFSRHFSPWIGIPEDPVTGSAHSYIATYWRDILNKKSFLARQCSQRGGDLRITLEENERMRVEGKSILTLEGRLFLN